MEFKLPLNTTLNTTNRHQEFRDAFLYLLETFPPTRTTAIEVYFLKKDGVNLSANGDYTSVDFPGCFNPLIRVSYGKNGRSRHALHTLFHEYKHLLQDDARELYGERRVGNIFCVEATAWAEEQVPIYLKTLEGDNADEKSTKGR